MGASLVALMVKNLPAMQKTWVGNIPWRIPLQYSCLEKPMDRGAWWATAHGVAKSWTRLKQLSLHSQAEKNKKKCSENYCLYFFSLVIFLF